MTWHIVTGEYPSQPGGVGDYTRNLACALAQAGDGVEVWAPFHRGATPRDEGVAVHRLPDHFGWRGLATIDRELNRYPGPRRILVQYVPHAFGYKAMNLPFCAWLYSRRRDRVWAMFHEVSFPVSWEQSPRHNALGLVTRLMARLTARAAERIWISILGWRRRVERYARGGTPVEWLPIPSNVARVDDPDGIAALRDRYLEPGALLAGHFGTYGREIAARLASLAPAILAAGGCSLLLLGNGSAAFRAALVSGAPRWSGRIHASGSLDEAALSRHLSACDLMIQPYPDGVSSRRTSVMAALSHGRAVVTTSGHLTEPLWAESGAVVLAPFEDTALLVERVGELLHHEGARKRLGASALELYENCFALSRTVSALRAAAA